MVALAVFIFIKIGIKLSPLQYLEQEPFETEYGVTGLVKEKESKLSRTLLLFVSLWCCSMYFICNSVDYCRLHGASDYVCTLCLAVLLILVSVGVNILIRVSTIKK